MQDLLNRLFRVERGEWPKLLQFGLFGLLLQTGMGIGFAAGDAAFLTHVGPDKLPVIFLLTPAVMLVYTAIFSFLLVRFSIDHVVDVTLCALIAGGAILWGLIQLAPPEPFDTALYYVLKLYLAMWYIALYSLFWNFSDAYFDIQDAKRLFPLFSAFCALGTTIGALVVSLFAEIIPMHGFLLVWSGVALATAPVALLLRRRWQRIADSDTDLDGESKSVLSQLGQVGQAFRTSPYAVTLVLTLFVTLLMTNLAEYQYSTVLQKGRSEADLAALFGQLYAGASIFNLVVCLFVFNRLVTRIGVRNVALILPLTYFAAFAYFFLVGGTAAALGAFFAYHGVLTSIEYNNQNLLFNATPSQVKRPFRTVVEGLAEPLASLLAGAFLLLAAKSSDMRELSGIGLLLGSALIAVVVALRHFYPGAMKANMRRGWLNFGAPDLHAPTFEADAERALRDRAAAGDNAAGTLALLAPHGQAPAASGPEPEAGLDILAAQLADPSRATRAQALKALAGRAGPGDIGLVGPLVDCLPMMDRASRVTILDLLTAIGDVEAIPAILTAAAQLSPRELRASEAMLVGLGDAAIPRLMQVLTNYQMPYRARAVAARALSTLSPAQFVSQLDKLVREEMDETGPRLGVAERFTAEAGRSPALELLATAYHQRIGESVDFTLELLALGGLLPDFDLLIVSLHSANPKVRANAVEAIASGVGPGAWRRLEPLITGKRAAAGRETGDLAPLLQAAVEEGRGFEAAAAAQALRDLTPEPDLAAALRPGLRGLSPFLRTSFARLLGVGGADQPTAVDLVAAVRAVPDFAGASIDAQVALAERATLEAKGQGPVELRLATRPFWISRADVDDVAARYADLALTMLKARDDRAYAR